MTQSRKIVRNSTADKKTAKPRPYFKAVVMNRRTIDGVVVELVKREKIDRTTHRVLVMHYIMRANNRFGQMFDYLKPATEALEAGDMAVLFPPREDAVVSEEVAAEA